MPNAFTFTLSDTQNLIPASIEAQISECALYVIGLVGRYIDWQGTIDFIVDIRPASELTWSDADGLLPGVAQLSWDGSEWVNDTLEECLTGVDSRADSPDAGCTIYLAEDGTIKNYGVPVWFDPDPRFDTDPGVPSGFHDFIGIYTHEIFHGLGFYEVTRQWRDRIVDDGAIDLFDGARIRSVYGRALPLADGSDHYGFTDDPSIGISRGLMFQWGNYEANRLDIGRIDLAVLEDLGHNIKSYQGLPLFELIDGETDLTGTQAAEHLFGDYHDNGLSGLGGDDRIRGGAGNDRLAGQDANDLLYGESGADDLDGGAGHDGLDGGPGGDIMRGGIGNDTYFVDHVGDQVSETSAGGTDVVRSAISYALGANLEQLVLTGSAAIDGAGNALANLITGNSGANLLDGKAGADTMSGGGGNDVYRIDDALDRIVETAVSGSSDTAISSVTYRLGAGVRVETLRTADPAGTAAIGLTGNEFANAITGNAGANLLKGLAGNDSLVGGAGADKLYGGPGKDVLKGESGADGFYFDAPLSASTNVDSIASFTSIDTIFLDRDVFTGIAASGALAASAFRAGTAAGDASDRIIYDAATGRIFYDADGIGGAAQILFATVPAGTALTAADMVGYI